MPDQFPRPDPRWEWAVFWSYLSILASKSEEMRAKMADGSFDPEELCETLNFLRMCCDHACLAFKLKREAEEQ